MRAGCALCDAFFKEEAALDSRIPHSQLYKDILHGIETLISSDAAFALFRTQGAEPVLMLQKNRKGTLYTHFADVKGSGFIFSPFAEEQGHPVILFRDDHVFTGWEEIAAGVKKVIHDDSLPPSTTPHVVLCPFEELKERLYKSPIDKGYQRAFSAILKDLQDGRFQKLVLSRSQDISGRFSAGRIFLNACGRYPNAMVSLVHGTCGTWVGASPEILLEGSREKGWRTMALAGTRPAGSTEAWDDKNRREQNIVAQYIESVLTPFAAKLEKSEPHTYAAGSVEHLRTLFTIQPKEGASIREIIEHLHPTPAVCGLPKEEAKRRILTTESHDRRYYAGFQGVWNGNENCSLYVNLRCLKLSAASIRLFAGGGIMPQSACEAEWLETCGKMCTMLSLLGK